MRTEGKDLWQKTRFRSSAIPKLLRIPLTKSFYDSHLFYLTVEIKSCFFQLSISTIENNCIISILEDQSSLPLIHVSLPPACFQ